MSSLREKAQSLKAKMTNNKNKNKKANLTATPFPSIFENGFMLKLFHGKPDFERGMHFYTVEFTTEV